jgi:hypothetical protein
MVILKEPISLCIAWRWLVVLGKYMACSAYADGICYVRVCSMLETLDTGTLG